MLGIGGERRATVDGFPDTLPGRSRARMVVDSPNSRGLKRKRKEWVVDLGFSYRSNAVFWVKTRLLLWFLLR